MKTWCGLVVVGLGLLLAPPRVAPAESGGASLLQYCLAAIEAFEGKALTPQTASNAAFCSGHITGMLDMHAMAIRVKGMPPPFCVPDSMDVIQAIRVVVRYLQSHPEDLHLDGSALAALALRDAFPCRPGAPEPRRR